jgi:uncharacterized protein YceK
MNGKIGLGATVSLSVMQALMQSIQSSFAAYNAAVDCTDAAGNLSSALNGCQSIIPMLQSFGGYPASYANQASTYVKSANSQPSHDSGGFQCVLTPWFNAVSSAVSFVASGVAAATQAAQQLQQSNAQSLSISTLTFGTLTVAVLGWPYSTRPIPAQVQGMFAASWQGAGQSFQQANLNVSSVVDTGRSDLLGNPIYAVGVSVSGGGTVTAYPASKAGGSGAGYNAVLCGTSQWCLGIASFQQGHLLPISPAPATTPIITFPVNTGFPIPTFTVPRGTTPVGVTQPPRANLPPAGTSSSGSDLLIGVSVTAGLAAVGAGIMWFAHRQHEREHVGVRR